MEIVAIEGFIARCSAKGIERDVNLFLLQHEELEPGDHVIVHVGYAIQKLSADEAQSTWDLYDEILAMEDTPASMQGTPSSEEIRGA